MRKVPVGIIGCGNISGIYIKNCFRLRNLELRGLADLDMGRTRGAVEDIKVKAQGEWKLAADTKFPAACSVEELLADREIELVINLTVPKAHAAVALQCLNAGKHTYHEKPFALSREEGKKVIELARGKNLRVGCAPDTFLG